MRIEREDGFVNQDATPDANCPSLDRSLLVYLFIDFFSVSVLGPSLFSLISPSEMFHKFSPIHSKLDSFSFPEKLLLFAFLSTEWCQHKIEMVVLS